jgi:hypothetical protein
MMGAEALEVYLPVRLANSTADLILLSGRLSKRSLMLTGKSLGLEGGEFQKAAPPRAPSDARSGTDVLRIAEVAGVQIGEESDQVFVNSGVTVGRSQNVVFRLPGNETLPPITLSVPDGGSAPLFIRRGIDNIRGTRAFESGLVEAGETVRTQTAPGPVR